MTEENFGISERDFKFRAWDKAKKVLLMPEKNPGCIWLTVGQDTGKDFVLVQYTGLKDKNDKEIYEGDIISVENMGCDPSNGDSPVNIVEVCWSKKEAMFYVTDQYFEMSESCNCEVIGNVFEDKELLK